MSIEQVVQGELFRQDYLESAICEDSDWSTVDPDRLAAELRPIFERFLDTPKPNESQTKEDLIWPVLRALGWTDYLRQQSLLDNGLHVPDGLLFVDEAAKSRANMHSEPWRRYEHGVAVVESTCWLRSLDEKSERYRGKISPLDKMFDYLYLANTCTNGRLLWGILTNGRKWRLYYQRARSVSKQFFQIDMEVVLSDEAPFKSDTVQSMSEENRNHWLRVFGLMFGRMAFVPSQRDSKAFNHRALERGRYHEEMVAQNLPDIVCQDVFPSLMRGLSWSCPDSSNEERRNAGLIWLFRLLTLFYAEDRNLLPMWDSDYLRYSMQNCVRVEVERLLYGEGFISPSRTLLWSAIADNCRIVTKGEPALKISPCGGDLFNPDRPPLFLRARLGDDVVAGIIDALSYDNRTGERRYVNYQDLSVQQLLSIYERLQEFEMPADSIGEPPKTSNLYPSKYTHLPM